MHHGAMDRLTTETDAPPASIHPTAIVEPGARVGRGTYVWHHAHVRAGAVIGERSSLGKNVYVDAGAVIGSDCKVQNNVSVYNGVTLEDDVFVGPSAVFTNDLSPRAKAPEWVLTPTLVRRGASIGANATILCGTELGTCCMVGAGAVVTKSVAPYELVLGNPARRAGWVCECGQRVSVAADPPPTITCDHCGRTISPGVAP